MARALHQNVPNPFNPTTTIPFDVQRAGRVTLRVFRPDGALVADVLDRVMPVGAHRMTWDGRDARGQQVASGVYMCRLDQEGGSWSIKMMLVR
jgi:flagellar hook assembly protein FlgD